MNVHQAPKWLPEVLVPFLTLSYPTARPTNPDSFPFAHYYGTGRLDACFVLTWILVLGVFREVLRLGFFERFTRKYLHSRTAADEGPKDTAHEVAHDVKKGLVTASTETVPNGISLQQRRAHGPPRNIAKRRPQGMSRAEWINERSVLRCAEQGWQFAYYAVYWPFGMYIHWALPSAPFQLDRLWRNYPHIPLAGPLKFYYLTQLGFWFHQVLLLNAEEWRKDHFQMMSHHVLTISLVTASYYYNFTRVGVLIMVLMDWCDIFLALAKITRYLRLPERVSDATFAIFSMSWIITRHILFGIVIYSAYREAPQLITFKWAPEQGHYLTRDAYIAFVCLMVALQFILFLWLVMLCRLVWKVMKGTPPDDIRSDDDGEDAGETAGHDSKKDE